MRNTTVNKFAIHTNLFKPKTFIAVVLLQRLHWLTNCTQLLANNMGFMHKMPTNIKYSLQHTNYFNIAHCKTNPTLVFNHQSMNIFLH